MENQLMLYCYFPDALKKELIELTREAGKNVCVDLFGSPDCEPGLSGWNAELKHANEISVS